MAAIGDTSRQQVIFVGGSDNPYNFNGIGYDGNPSQPVDSVIAFDVVNNLWKELGFVEQATMDHRNLLKFNNSYVTVGGMGTEQTVLTKTQAISLEN